MNKATTTPRMVRCGTKTAMIGPPSSSARISQVAGRVSQSCSARAMPQELPWSWTESAYDSAAPESHASLSLARPAPR